MKAVKEERHGKGKRKGEEAKQGKKRVREKEEKKEKKKKEKPEDIYRFSCTTLKLDGVYQ